MTNEYQYPDQICPDCGSVISYDGDCEVCFERITSAGNKLFNYKTQNYE